MSWKLPKKRIAEVFQDVDLILHAGDLYVISVIDWLETIAPTVGVAGGGIDNALLDDPRMAKLQRLTLEGHKLGLIHILHLPPHQPFEETMGGPVDIIVCGDTHDAVIEEYDGVLLVNPGSATLPTINHRMDLPGTIGLLDITNGRVEAQIVTLD